MANLTEVAIYTAEAVVSVGAGIASGTILKSKTNKKLAAKNFQTKEEAQKFMKKQGLKNVILQSAISCCVGVGVALAGDFAISTLCGSTESEATDTNSTESTEENI